MTEVKLVAVGDILLQTKQGKHPFKEIEHLLKEKDLLFGNLETPLTTQKSRNQKLFSLSSPPEVVGYLKDIKFDVVNIANNHILDCGPEGYLETIRALDQNSIQYIGGEKTGKDTPSVLIERGGVIFGFLGYSMSSYHAYQGMHLNKEEERGVLRDIDLLKKQCDAVSYTHLRAHET